jgi:branched-chain amino acid transport system ATP-binding protein
MKTLVGLLRPRAGTISIDDRDVTKLSPPQRALAGLGYVPQERNVFKNLTIGENLQIGFEFIRRKASAKDYAAACDRVLDLFPDLSPRLNALAGTLSGGQRQMLAMGCALIPGPTSLLLDEPSAGLSPRYVATMLDAVAAVNRSGVTVIMIEQNLIEAMRVTHDVILLVAGEIKGTWEPEGFLSDPQVRALFLGGATAKAADAGDNRITDDASAA